MMNKIDFPGPDGKIPTSRLNNGVEMPVLGLGTWQGVPGKEDEVSLAVKIALDVGYRHFDCAHIYGNEKAIGQVIQGKIKSGQVKREDLFITSKLWCNAHRPDLVEPAILTTLRNLQLEYLDLYLIHWPMGFQEGEDLMPKDPKTGQILFSEVDYTKTWLAMETVYRKNLTRAIGLSNFNRDQMQRVLQTCSVTPQVNQVECHPYLNQSKLSKYCDGNGIVVTAYSPLGGPRTNVKPGEPDVLNDEKVKSIADRYGKTPGQVLLRYNLQVGHVVIPKSANEARLRQNIEVFDFCLAPESMSELNGLDNGGRVCRFEEEAVKMKHGRRSSLISVPMEEITQHKKCPIIDRQLVTGQRTTPIIPFNQESNFDQPLVTKI